MPKLKKGFDSTLDLARIRHENVSWSNVIIDSPVPSNVLERRVMYFLTGEVKHKFVEKGLGVPEKWKELYFKLTDRDLGLIGGKKNIPRTYETLTKLVEKLITLSYSTSEGNDIVGHIHWVDSFFYNKESDSYLIRISPEIMPYLINITQNFTSFDVGTALKLRSKYTQKLYEICCKYGGDYRYTVMDEAYSGFIYKKRVVPIQIDEFRKLFSLNEIKDERTGKIIQPSQYVCYSDIKKNILSVAQDELYYMYVNEASDVWFDYQPGDKKGKGGKISSIILYIYTRKHPKDGEQRPWKPGDMPLIPYESHETKQVLSPSQKIRTNEWYDVEGQEYVVFQLLSRYLAKGEVAYYMRIINIQARKYKDTYTQVIQVIQEKERQPKFQNGTKHYKRKNMMEYVLCKNLMEYGWHIDPPESSKGRKMEKDLFVDN
ncbi:MAG: replication initiation protein [Prevotella sp.]|nr:replication initiation protein [Prevotella sp.]